MILLFELLVPTLVLLFLFQVAQQFASQRAKDAKQHSTAKELPIERDLAQAAAAAATRLHSASSASMSLL